MVRGGTANSKLLIFLRENIPWMRGELVFFRWERGWVMAPAEGSCITSLALIGGKVFESFLENVRSISWLWSSLPHLKQSFWQIHLQLPNYWSSLNFWNKTIVTINSSGQMSPGQSDLNPVESFTQMQRNRQQCLRDNRILFNVARWDKKVKFIANWIINCRF